LKPKIVVSVSNDLVTDQRVKKVCQTLHEEGFEIVLLGRKLPESLPIERPYRVSRMRLIFRKKVWFYAEFNLRLFFKLLFLKKDIMVANDLDTLLPNFLIAKLFGKKLVYDSHELFTEIPELMHRPKVRNVWLQIEKRIFPHLKNVITVNSEIARIFENKYQVPVKVIRNISPKLTLSLPSDSWIKEVKGTRKMLIIQGSGINKDRGAEEAVQMMPYLDDVLLLIIGSGDVIPDLKVMIQELHLDSKVKIIGKLPYLEMLQYTQIADLGLSLDKGTNLNYELSLPNKVFDYIQCSIPLMVSNRKVVAQIVQEAQIGVVFEEHHPKQMADLVKDALYDKERYQKWKTNLKLAAAKYNWENESQILKDIYKHLS
jgi:glycosyltransferase involved in cell wall biosynthesis